jgi:predicted Na+-dependent transporter
MFNADLALSVTMTAISTVFSVISMPVNLLLYTRFSYQNDIISKLDWSSLFVALFIVISAITLGLFCSSKIHTRHFNRTANRLGNIAGVSLMAFSACMSNSGDSKIYSYPWDFYVSTAMPCIAGLVLANVLCTFANLKKPERVTVAIECCYQNVGIATSLALTMFEGDDVAIAMGVPFFYGLVEAVLVGLYCLVAWKAGWTKAPADTPFFHMLWTSYEVVQQEQYEIDGIEIGISKSHEPQSDEIDDNILTHYYHMACSKLDADYVPETLPTRHHHNNSSNNNRLTDPNKGAFV